MSNWYLAVCGINHKTSSLDEREPFQLGREDFAAANAAFSNHNGILESAIVSTCNRVEFYFVAKRDIVPFDIVAEFYKEFKNIDITDRHENFYVKKNKHAVDHLFRVAAGIESMVLGENQILGQIKEAYSSACAVKAAGKIVHRLFHQAFRVGKITRTDTEMGKGACSVSNAAIEMLSERLKNLDNPKILFVGINQMISLAANGLRRLEYNNFAFANRTGSKAVEFASRYNADGYPLGDLPKLLTETDVIITCTGATEAIISASMLDDVVAGGGNRRIIIMDMAVPRDTDIEKDYHDSVEVLDLEDIKHFVADQQAIRAKAIPQVEQIIDRKLGEFNYWFDHVRYEPIYNGIYDAYENIRRDELKTVLENLEPEQSNIVNQATKNLVNKLVQLKIRLSADKEKSE